MIFIATVLTILLIIYFVYKKIEAKIKDSEAKYNENLYVLQLQIDELNKKERR